MKSRQTLLRRGPLRRNTLQHHRSFSIYYPKSPPDPRGGQRSASTSAQSTDWLGWIKKAPIPVIGGGGNDEHSRKALIFAGLVSDGTTSRR